MRVAVLGFGTVGKGVGQLIDAMQDPSVELYRILMIPQFYDESDPRQTTSYEEILDDDSIDVVVECIGGLEPAHTYAVQALSHHKSFVTSNKKMMAVYRRELVQLAKENGVFVRCEASVGGGITWLKSLERICRVEAVEDFYGIFNGTTNYILSNMEKSSQSFAQLLKQAQDAGYAEKDPTDDIEGYDISNKVALSCYEGLGLYVQPDEVMRFSLAAIQEKDIAYAKSIGCVVKYIGYGKRDYAYVIPTLVPQRDLLANIGDNYNGMLCHSLSLGTSFFSGQGAGSLPTGNAVVQDLLDIKNGHLKTRRVFTRASFDFSKKIGVYYVRSANLKEWESMIQERIDETTVLTKPIALCDVKAVCDKQKAFVMEVM